MSNNNKNNIKNYLDKIYDDLWGDEKPKENLASDLESLKYIKENNFPEFPNFVSKSKESDLQKEAKPETVAEEKQPETIYFKRT